MEWKASANVSGAAARAFLAKNACHCCAFRGFEARSLDSSVAAASNGTRLTVHDVLVSAEGHLRAVAYYLYDWRLKDGSRVSFDCADVFNFDPSTGHLQSIVLVYDTHPVRGVVENKYP